MPSYRKNKTTEPGYRYANERRAYLALTPEQRQAAKKVLEEIWQGRGVTAVRKNMVACPVLVKDKKD